LSRGEFGGSGFSRQSFFFVPIGAPLWGPRPPRTLGRVFLWPLSWSLLRRTTRAGARPPPAVRLPLLPRFPAGRPPPPCHNRHPQPIQRADCCFSRASWHALFLMFFFLNLNTSAAPKSGESRLAVFGLGGIRIGMSACQLAPPRCSAAQTGGFRRGCGPRNPPPIRPAENWRGAQAVGFRFGVTARVEPVGQRRFPVEQIKHLTQGGGGREWTFALEKI